MLVILMHSENAPHSLKIGPVSTYRVKEMREEVLSLRNASDTPRRNGWICRL